jgi:hypothetical protein
VVNTRNRTTERKTRTRKITAGREIKAKKNYERQTRQRTQRESQPERENKHTLHARERERAKQIGAQNRNPKTEDRRSLLLGKSGRRRRTKRADAGPRPNTRAENKKIDE